MLVPKCVFRLRELCREKVLREPIRGVRLERDANGKPWAVSTDGVALAAATWREPAAEGLPEAMRACHKPWPGFGATLRPEDAEAADKRIPKRPAAHAFAALSEDVDQVRAVGPAGAELPLQPVGYPYPDWSGLVDRFTYTDGDCVQVDLEARRLVRLVEALRHVAVNAEPPRITLTVPLPKAGPYGRPEARPIRIEVKGKGVEAVGLLMPLAPPPSR